MKNNLNDSEELFDIPAKYSCSYVGARMDRALIGNVDHYQQYQDVPHEPFLGSGKYISYNFYIFCNFFPKRTPRLEMNPFTYPLPFF